ncbi:MAG: helix-turn-helix transcriptional regulator [Candidatus Nomurabacteria bacterium]|jgi:DNA-binding HxlR family transcriptional regulator|nr:helix-turn-helix transcriptional regulator [Candidatus Nomurabacteria bacterium]
MIIDCKPGECPVEATVGLVSNKWKIFIIGALINDRVLRFGELLKKTHGISQKVLTDNLRDLERDGLVSRTVYAEVPPRVEYSLTDLGLSLTEVLKEVEKWGREYLKTHPFPNKYSK